MTQISDQTAARVVVMYPNGNTTALILNADHGLHQLSK